MNKKRLQTLAGMLNENTMFISNGIHQPQPFGVISIHPDMPVDLQYGEDSDSATMMHTYDQEDFSEMFENEEDEVGMVKADIEIMLADLEHLHTMLCHLHEAGTDVNFPHWWQSKIVIAKDYVGKATDYLDQEMANQ